MLFFGNLSFLEVAVFVAFCWLFLYVLRSIWRWMNR